MGNGDDALTTGYRIRATAVESAVLSGSTESISSPCAEDSAFYRNT